MSSSRFWSVIAWIGRQIPTAIVLGALGAVAVWGHRHDWEIPRFSASPTNGEATEWCETHGVPEALCVECQPGLLPKPPEYGWCRIHGIPNCPLEHPDVAQLPHTPLVSEADLERARRTLEFAPRPENSTRCKLHQRRLQFASQESYEKARIDVAPVWEAPMVEMVEAAGEVTYDQTRVARLSARVPGSAWRVLRQVGDVIQRGEILALIDAAEVGKAKAEYLQALVQMELRERNLAGLRKAPGTVAERQIWEGEASVHEAEIRLRTAEQGLVNLGLPLPRDPSDRNDPAGRRRQLQLLGLPEAITRTFESEAITANLLPILAPLDGVIVSREVVAGEVVDTTKVLFTIADTSRMWLTLNLRQEDTRRVARNQPVRFRNDGTGEEARGTVCWISTAVDEKTRTVKVRAELDNAAGKLRANAFGQGQILLREEKNAVVVPHEAVHWDGDCHVVFVRDRHFLQEDAPKVFHVRKVRIAANDARHTEIIAGVLPGELVATRGSGTLRAELLKGNLGEG